MRTTIFALILSALLFGSAHASEPFVLLRNNSDIGEGNLAGYKVNRGDTLAKIVMRFYPHNSDHSAIFRQIVSENPHAFIRMNPNKLMAGKVLKLPGLHNTGLDRGDDIYFF